MIQAGVIGVGQTKYDAKRRDVSMAGLVREAIDNAMLAANVEWDAIDAVVLWRTKTQNQGFPKLNKLRMVHRRFANSTWQCNYNPL